MLIDLNLYFPFMPIFLVSFMFQSNHDSGYFVQVLAKLTMLYEEMRGGYATADATVSLQSILIFFSTSIFLLSSSMHLLSISGFNSLQ